MPIPMRCSCGAVWSAPEADSDGAVTCPTCGSAIPRSPAPSPASADPANADATRLATPPTHPAGSGDAVRPGMRLGKYQIEAVLGRGGMGCVYRARDIETDRCVALKTLLPGLEERDPDLVPRFEREARALAQASHPGIVAIHETGTADGIRYIAMDLVDGDSLQALLRRGLPPREGLEFLCGVAEALTHAHARGILHRDLKPSNIMIDRSGRPILMDFGLAKVVETGDESHALTQTGQVLGTPLYMAPEQVRGDRDRIGPATDLYALGAIAYEIVAGRPPFVRDTMAEILAAIVSSPVPRPRAELRGLPAALDDVILKSLHRDPARRYATAELFARHLRRTLAGEVGEAGPRAGARASAGGTSRRGTWVVAGIGLALLVAGIWAAKQALQKFLPGGEDAALASSSTWLSQVTVVKWGWRLAPASSPGATDTGWDMHVIFGLPTRDETWDGGVLSRVTIQAGPSYGWNASGSLRYRFYPQEEFRPPDDRLKAIPTEPTRLEILLSVAPQALLGGRREGSARHDAVPTRTADPGAPSAANSAPSDWWLQFGQGARGRVYLPVDRGVFQCIVPAEVPQAKTTVIPARDGGFRWTEFAQSVCIAGRPPALLLTTSDHLFKYDLKTGETLLSLLLRSRGPIYPLGDGEYVLLSDNGEVRDVAALQVVRRLDLLGTAHSGGGGCIPAATGTRIAVSVAGGTDLVDAFDPGKRTTLPVPMGTFSCARVGRGAEVMYTLVGDNNPVGVHRFDLAKGEEQPVMLAGRRVRRIALSPNGRWLAFTTPESVGRLDLDEQVPLGEVSAPREEAMCRVLAISDDGEKIAFGNGHLCVAAKGTDGAWSASVGDELTLAFGSIVFSPDGERIFATGSAGQIRLVVADVHGRDLLRAAPRHSRPVISLAALEAPPRLFSLDESGLLLRWSIGEEALHDPAGLGVWSAARTLHPTKRAGVESLIVGPRQQPPSGVPESEAKALVGPAASPTAYDARGDIVAWLAPGAESPVYWRRGDDREVHQTSARVSGAHLVLLEGNPASCLAIAEEEMALVDLSAGAITRRWKVTMGPLLRARAGPSTSAGSTEQNFLLVYSDRLEVLRLPEGEVPASVAMKTGARQPLGPAEWVDSQRIAFACADRVMLWDTGRREVSSLGRLQTRVRSLAVIPGGLAVGCEDGTVAVIRIGP